LNLPAFEEALPEGREHDRFESVLDCHNGIQNFRISGVIRVFTIDEVFFDQAATAAEMI
jgi:hypothetical protein